MALNKYGGNFVASHGEIIVSVYGRKREIKDVVLKITDISHPSEQTERLKKFEAKGHLLLTNRGFAWIGKPGAALSDFSCSFGSVSKFELKQPVLGANYIKGTTKGEPGQYGFKGEVDWRLTFNNGGAVDWGKTLIATQKNPPTVSMMHQQQQQPIQLGAGYQMGYNQTGYRQPDGTFYFPPAGSAAGPSTSTAAPPSYGHQNYGGGQAPPQYNDFSYSAPPPGMPPADNYPPTQQGSGNTFPGAGGSKAGEAGYR